MKITYEFINGEISEVEISEEIGEIIMSSRNREHADAVTHHRHCPYSLDGFAFEGEAFLDEESPEKIFFDKIEEEEMNNRVERLKSEFTPVQNRRVSLREEKKTIEEIAGKEGCSPKAVSDSINLVKKKTLKFYKNLSENT